MKHMETRLFEPKAQPKDLRIMRRRAQRLPEEYPTYKMIPSSEVMSKILNSIAALNGAIKFPECPIRKQTFYQLKTRVIQYMLTLIKAGQVPADWSYKFNGVETAPENPGHYLAAIELFVGPEKFQFHTGIDNPLMCILFQQIYQAPIKDFYADAHHPLEVTRTLDVWENLLMTFEDSNWFIYEQQIVHGWVDSINNYYPKLKFRLAPGVNVKLATMLAGGPMIQAKIKDNKYSDVCKFNDLRDNFANWLEKIGHRGDFSLCLKKDYII